MPLQNRVTPTGDIVATPHRGMFTGNRGIIHDPATKTADAALGEPGVAHLRLRIQGPAARGDGRPQLDRAVLSRRGNRVRGGTSPVLLLPPRRRQPVSRGVGGGQRRSGACWRATSMRCSIASGSRARQEAAASRCRCRWQQLPDGAMLQEGDGELSDRAGPGASVVAGRLSQGAKRDRGRHAADAALDAARVDGGISAGAACECDGAESVTPLILVMRALLRAGAMSREHLLRR